MAERYYDRLVYNLSYEASQYGFDLQTYMLLAYGQEAEEYEPDLKDAAKTAVRQVLLMQAIAKEEGMEVTDEDVEADLEQSAAEYGYDSADDYREVLGNEVLGYREMLLTQRMTEYLVDQATVHQIDPDEAIQAASSASEEGETTDSAEEEGETSDSAEEEETAAPTLEEGGTETATEGD